MRTNTPRIARRTPAAPKRSLLFQTPQCKPARDERSFTTREWSPGDAPWESDAELVREILSGSREHFDLLYRVYFPRVYRFALKRLGDPGEAEDVTQEVFMTVFDALHTYAGESRLLIWIFGITRNKVNRRFRRTRPRFEVIDTDDRTGDRRPRRFGGSRRRCTPNAGAMRGGGPESADAAAEADLSSEAPAQAIDPLHRRCSGQVGRCREGESLPDATSDRPGRTGSTGGSGRLSFSDRPLGLLSFPEGKDFPRHISPIPATYLM